MKKTLITSALLLSITGAQAFDFGSLMDSVKDAVPAISETLNSSEVNKKSTPTNTTDASASTVAMGLKAALKQGVDFGVKELGKDGGYLNNANVKIPLPQNLAKMESMIRSAGGDKVADDLINSMNLAAAKSALKAAPIFIDSIDKMSIEDAKQILAGGNTAATDYFQKHTTKDLKNMMKPIIQETMKENNVASYHDTFNGYYGSGVKMIKENESIMGYAKSFGVDQFIPDASDENLDDYVTRSAIDGLYKMIGQKEAEIRDNPVAQTTSILQQVFGK